MRTLKIILLLGLFNCISSLYAQPEDESYLELREKGIKNYNSQNFQEALTDFRLARVADDKPQRNDIDQWIEKTFNGYVVLLNKEKDRALKAEKEARLEARANELAALSINLSKSKPTEAIRVTEYALGLTNNSKIAKQQLHDLISINPPPFYGQSIELPDLISTVAISPDDQYILIGCWNKHLYLFKGLDNQILDIAAHNEPIIAVKFSPNGKYLLSASMDNTAKLWDLKGKLIQTFEGHFSDVSAIAFAPNGQLIATGSWDESIKIWDINGDCIKTIPADLGFITCLAFCPDGQSFWSGGMVNAPVRWALNGDSLQTLSGHTGAVTAINFSKKGDIMVTGGWDGKVIIWDYQGKMLHEIEVSNKPVNNVVLFPKEHQFIATIDKSEAYLIKFSGEIVQKYQEHLSWINGLDISADADFFLTGSLDKTVKTWPLKGPLIQKFKEDSFPLNNLAYFHQKDAFLISRTKGPPVLKDRNWNTILTLEGHKDEVSEVAISPNGKYFATASYDKTAKVWDQTGKLLTTFTKHISTIRTIAFSPNEAYLISGGNDDQARMWTIDGTEVQVFKGHKSDVTSVCFSPDGKYILTASRDKTAKLWNLQGELIQTFEGHTNELYSACFSQDGLYVATTSHDNTAILWDLDGRQISKYIGHKTAVYEGKFTPDGKHFLTSDHEGIIKLWDLDGNELQTISLHNGFVKSFSLIDKGKKIVSVSNDSTFRIISTWEDYLASNKIEPLNHEKAVHYGLIQDTSELFTAKGKAKQSNTYFPEKFILMNFKDRQKRGWGFQDRYAFWTSMYFSHKANFSNNLDEKLLHQQHSLKLSADFTRNFITPYYHGNMAIWELADGKKDKALSLAEKAIDLAENTKGYSNYAQITALMKGKQAIIFACNEQLEEAESIVQECKDLDLKIHNFKDIYQKVTGNELGSISKVSDILLLDINFLISSEINHPNLFKIKELLIVKP